MRESLFWLIHLALSGHGRRLQAYGPLHGPRIHFAPRVRTDSVAHSQSINNNPLDERITRKLAFSGAGSFINPEKSGSGDGVDRRSTQCGRQHSGLSRMLRAGAAAIASALVCIMAMSPQGPACTRLLSEVQSPFDRQVDVALRPFCRILQPLLSMVSWIILSPVRVHMRIESIRAGVPSHRTRKLQSASNHTCRIVQAFADVSCPKVMIVRGEVPKLAAFPLGLGREMLLVATQGFADKLEGAALRFAIGREIGRAALGHGARLPRWSIARFADDNLALPRYAAARFASLARFANGSLALPRQAAAWFARRLQRPKRDLQDNTTFATNRVAGNYARDLTSAIYQVGEFCELYRGLRTGGAWPGLGDLDMDGLFPCLTGCADNSFYKGNFMLKPTSAPFLNVVDRVAAVGTQVMTPEGSRALTGALLGTAALKLAAVAFDFDEAVLRRNLRISAWAFGIWAVKLRAEIFSADRFGLIAASGDLDAAVQAMVHLAGNGRSAALAALVGTDTLAKEAQTLDRVMPRATFAVEPSLHTRIAELTAWARSPEGARILQQAGAESRLG